jgi:hypothetical protein
MGRIIPYIMENKKCLKPPTSDSLVVPTPTRICLSIGIIIPTNERLKINKI